MTSSPYQSVSGTFKRKPGSPLNPEHPPKFSSPLLPNSTLSNYNFQRGHPPPLSLPPSLAHSLPHPLTPSLPPGRFLLSQTTQHTQSPPLPPPPPPPPPPLGNAENAPVSPDMDVVRRGWRPERRAQYTGGMEAKELGWVEGGRHVTSGWGWRATFPGS